MTFKTILACIQSEETAPNVIDWAVAMAGAHQAHLVGLHLQGVFPVYADVRFGVSDDLIAQMNLPVQDKAERMGVHFAGKLKSLPLSSEWRCPAVNFGRFAELLVQEAQSADLIICAQNTEADDEDTGVNLAEMLVMGTGRPVLILPKKAAPANIPNRVMVAWNNSREATRAVFDSIPLLKQASYARILTFIEDEGDRTTSKKASRQLSDSLVRHGVEGEIDVSFLSEGSISGALMRSLTDNNCNLLVMGCYGHSHFREIVLGGASRDMLRDLSIPVLMAH